MSYGECDKCEHYLTTEEYNIARVLRPTGREPILCLVCIREIIAEGDFQMNNKTEVKWVVKQGVGRFEVILCSMDCIYLDKIAENEGVSRESVLEAIIIEALYEFSKNV